MEYDISYIEAALTEAQDEADTAYMNVINTADRNEQGHIKDSCGGAYILARFKSRKLLMLMKKGDFVTHSGHSGTWVMSARFPRRPTEQGLTAFEKSNDAARMVLEAKFVNDAEFYVKAYVD